MGNVESSLHLNTGFLGRDHYQDSNLQPLGECSDQIIQNGDQLRHLIILGQLIALLLLALWSERSFASLMAQVKG